MLVGFVSAEPQQESRVPFKGWGHPCPGAGRPRVALQCCHGPPVWLNQGAKRRRRPCQALPPSSGLDVTIWATGEVSPPHLARHPFCRRRWPPERRRPSWQPAPGAEGGRPWPPRCPTAWGGAGGGAVGSLERPSPDSVSDWLPPRSRRQGLESITRVVCPASRPLLWGWRKCPRQHGARRTSRLSPDTWTHTCPMTTDVGPHLPTLGCSLENALAWVP